VSESSFSVMVPASHEEAELDAAIKRLLESADPPSEVLIAVEDDDSPGRAVALQTAARHPGLVQVVAEDGLFDVVDEPPLPADDSADHEEQPAGSYSVMVPAPHDEAALEATLARLAAGDDPPSEVLVVVGTDDAAARAVAEQAAANHPRLVQVVTEAGLFDVMAGDATYERASPTAPLVDAVVGARRALARAATRVPWRAVAIAVAVAVVAASIRSGAFVYLLYIGVSLVLGVIAATTLVWMVHAWRTPASLAESGLGQTGRAPAFSFSLIVPARHEQAVLEATLSHLVRSDHPDFEVLVVVGSDDPETREAAERVAGRHPDRVKVVIDSSWPKSKPKALNAALPHCSGVITGVFDAEDDVHPALLQRVDQCFQTTDADVVQAGVQLMNFRSSWWTVRNVLEYYFWFRSRLHFHARQGFIPLGGNTIFVRTEVLRAVSGWDPECLAEDCELGVRLSACGARTVVFYEPELVTREECPPTLGAFARQRTRWNQGYLQTLSRGYWRRLPFRQRALGLYTLAMPYLMAVVWLTIPIAIATALAVKAPVPITLISFLPALPMLSMLAVEVAGLGEFCRAYGERATARDYGRLIVGVLVYQSVLAYAAARAVVREARGKRGWEKTPHLGLHLVQDVDAEPERATLRVVENYAAQVGGGPVIASRGSTAVLEVVEAPPPDNGRGGRDDLFDPGDGTPLWLRLGGGSTNGALSLPLPKTARRSAVRSHADLLVVGVLLIAVTLFQAPNMLHWPETQFDEGTYMANAWAVHHGALAPYTYSYGHPPLAWLFIFLWSSMRGVFAGHSFSIDSGREFMFVLTLVSCSLLFTLARRLGMGRAFAAAAVLLFALSPVSLYFHRAVLLDNVAIAWHSSC
jgi:cellulose synthase/poly-beta-1,6-N-acetylglucosamine synthase-like glycosyltransferase